jgi:hypothetical protein
MTTKTFSNRSNAKRAIAAFRDKHPDLVIVGLSLVPTGTRGASGDAQTIEATGVLTKFASDAVEAAGFTLKAADLPAAPKADAAKREAKANEAGEREHERAEARRIKEAARLSRAADKADAKAEVAKAKAEAKEARATAKAKEPAAVPTDKPARTGAKTELVIGLLRRRVGATVQDIMDQTDWLPHTTRAFISATLGKKMGLKIESEKSDHGRVYRIAA